MRRILVGFFFALMMSLPLGASRADLDTVSTPPSNAFELIVVEADGCIYCKLFRRDVLPAYEASEQGKEAPVRFLDVNDIDTARLDLTSTVNIVPTFVIVKSHREVGRIAGYVGPENFFHSINYLIASAP
ncbi:hypothetical protein HYPDE_23983 [Hyphomicrobium denitrificans 1NES1]|jgi:thioredoxin-related protein|uniref:Thioredoxin-like fold domain-containing protein n=1 Tax=Hyphomicrobium denitrificans 1NES1 TaxID=670307 RepID=N0B2T6_9HYPH|nr:hypothetical protein [Hyphomicrobium denitrificans]AGK56482.1 hypothetical protein HYPDE_23983 [Hyphomicrobium denitrificans 1NES1]